MSRETNVIVEFSGLRETLWNFETTFVKYRKLLCIFVGRWFIQYIYIDYIPHIQVDVAFERHCILNALYEWMRVFIGFDMSARVHIQSTLGATCLQTGSWFNIKILYRYVGFHYKDETAMRSSYLYNGNNYTCKTASLYWNSPPWVIYRFLLWSVDFPYHQGLLQGCWGNMQVSKKYKDK